jgi:hypothetical protein
MCTFLLRQNPCTFGFMDLPAELRIEIYRYALLPGNHMVLRKNLPHISSLRYRFNEQPTLLRENCDDGSVVFCKDYECRHRSTHHEHTVDSVRLHDFAFGLFLTSKETSYDAIKIFFGETHFVFESRLDLHMFLKANKHARCMKSLTFNGRKSHGPHSKLVKARFTTWKLRSERHWGPTVSASIRELAELCPALVYIEMLDDRRCDAVQNHLDLQTKAFISWEEVKCIRSIRLQGFSYLLPDMERYETLAARGLVVAFTSYFDGPLQQQNVLRKAVEAFVLDNIGKRQGFLKKLARSGSIEA